MPNLRVATGLLACGLVFACGPKLTFEGSRVKLIDRAHGDCQPIGNVRGVGSSTETAEVEIRNQAGTMNANALVIEERGEGSDGSIATGIAYRCQASTP